MRRRGRPRTRQDDAAHVARLAEWAGGED